MYRVREGVWSELFRRFKAVRASIGAVAELLQHKETVHLGILCLLGNGVLERFGKLELRLIYSR